MDDVPVFLYQSGCIEDGGQDYTDVQSDSADWHSGNVYILSLISPKIARGTYSRRQTGMTNIVFDMLNFVNSSVASFFFTDHFLFCFRDHENLIFTRVLHYLRNFSLVIYI